MGTGAEHREEGERLAVSGGQRSFRSLLPLLGIVALLLVVVFLILLSVWIFSGHFGPVHALAISADGRVLATGSSDQTVKLWRMPQGQRNR